MILKVIKAISFIPLHLFVTTFYLTLIVNFVSFRFLSVLY